MGIYLNATGNFGDRDTRGDELGFDYAGGGVTVGGDYRFNDAVVGGAAFTYTRMDQDFDFDSGGIEANTYAGSLYGAARFENFYLDGLFGYARSDIQLERRIVYFEKTSGDPKDGSVDETATEALRKG